MLSTLLKPGGSGIAAGLHFCKPTAPPTLRQAYTIVARRPQGSGSLGVKVVLNLVSALCLYHWINRPPHLSKQRMP